MRMSFLGAYKSFWQNYFHFKGRTTRKEYWFVQLWNLILLIIWSILSSYIDVDLQPSGNIVNTILLIVCVLYGLASIIPLASLTCRRFIDAGFSRVWCIGGWSAKFIIDFIQGYSGESNFLLVLSGIISLLMCMVTVLPTDNVKTKFNQ